MRNAHSAAEGISSDAVTGLFDLVVDGVCWAGSTFAVDVDKASNADAGESVDIELLIAGAVGSADSQLSIIVARSDAGSADSLDKVVVRETSADIIDHSFVESADWDGNNGINGNDDLFSALALNELVALGADAVEVIDVVCGIGRTDIAGSSDEVVTIVTIASPITIYLVFAADWVGGVEFVAHSVLHVVVEDTDTFAQNVVVDLVGRAHNSL